MVKITIDTGSRGGGGRKFVRKQCRACNGFGCSGCNHIGEVGVFIPPNPPKKCSVCNGTGHHCSSCNNTGWMNGFAL